MKILHTTLADFVKNVADGRPTAVLWAKIRNCQTNINLYCNEEN